MTSGHPRGRLNLQRKDKIFSLSPSLSFLLSSRAPREAVQCLPDRVFLTWLCLRWILVSLGLSVCVCVWGACRGAGIRGWLPNTQRIGWSSLNGCGRGLKRWWLGGYDPYWFFSASFRTCRIFFFFLLPFCSVIYPINIVHKKLGVSIWIAFFAVFFCCYLPVKYNSYETWSQHFSFLRRLFLSTCL